MAHDERCRKRKYKQFHRYASGEIEFKVEDLKEEQDPNIHSQQKRGYGALPTDIRLG